VKKRTSGRFFGKPKDPPRKREKALKREAQERGKLKKASEGEKADTVQRVAKP
jgi:ribosomal protein S25